MMRQTNNYTSGSYKYKNVGSIAGNSCNKYTMWMWSRNRAPSPTSTCCHHCQWHSQLLILVVVQSKLLIFAMILCVLAMLNQFAGTNLRLNFLTEKCTS